MIWAKNIGCTWSSETIQIAASNLHDELVKYLFINGCPVDHKVFEIYASDNNIGIS